MRDLTATFAAIALLSTALTAHGRDGGGGLELRHRPTARATAMAEAGLVVFAGRCDFTDNPALLPWTAASRIGAGYARLAQGVPASATTLSALMPFGPRVEIPGQGDIGRRFGLGFCLDHVGVELSQGTEWGWNLVSLGLGYRLAPYVSAGIASKYLLSSSNLEGSGVQAYALDIGAAIELTPRVGLGVTVKNLVGNAGWDEGESESPPLLISAGCGFAIPYGVSGEVTGTVSGSLPARFGVGFDVPLAATGIDVRAGYLRYSGDYSRGILCGGLGYSYGRLYLDYAVRVDDEVALGTTHHVTLGYSLQ